MRWVLLRVALRFRLMGFSRRELALVALSERLRETGLVSGSLRTRADA